MAQVAHIRTAASGFIAKGFTREACRAGICMASLHELKRESRHLEDQGAGREADNQAAVLARILGLPAVQVERGLTLFLAVLVEIGAALGLYFATGHLITGGSASARRGRGVTLIEAEARKHLLAGKPAQAAIKQFAAATPRRVPRLNQHGIEQ